MIEWPSPLGSRFRLSPRMARRNSLTLRCDGSQYLLIELADAITYDLVASDPGIWSNLSQCKLGPVQLLDAFTLTLKTHT